MPEPSQNARIVLTTASDPNEAMRLGRSLVDERLAACTTIVPAVQSVYRWKGVVETTNEAMLLIKTSTEALPALEARLHALHSYDTPEFLVLPVESGSAPYLEWLYGNLSEPGEADGRPNEES